MSDLNLTHSGLPTTVYDGQFDHLPVPGGGDTIGTTADTQVLSRIFHRMGIPKSHTLGRELLSQRCAALLKKSAVKQATRRLHVRFTPETGPLCAKSRLMHCSNQKLDLGQVYAENWVAIWLNGGRGRS